MRESHAPATGFADRTTAIYDLPGVRISIQFGHYVLGHEPAASVSSQAVWQRAQEQRELDANAKAVEILVRAKGMSQRDAVQIVAEALQRAQRAVDRGAPLTPGHLTPAEELADLRARFPEAR